MTAVILAAGVASRLRPLTDTLPKSLLNVGGVPLLQRSLSALHSAGIRQVVIVTGFLHEKIEQFVGSLPLELQISFVYNDHYNATGNNYSLWLATQKVVGRDMVMLDADILFDRKILTGLLGAPQNDALVVRTTSGLGVEEVKVECDADGYVLRIGKEVDPKVAVGESLGIEKFSAPTVKRLFSVLDRRKSFGEFYEASFQEIIDNGVKVFALESGAAPCIEIDTFEDLKAAQILAGSIST